MKIQVESTELTKIARQSEDALCIAQEFAKGHGQEISKISDAIDNLSRKLNGSSYDEKKISSIENRLSNIELQFEQLRNFLIEKSSTTGKEKPSIMGRKSIAFFRK